MKSTAQESVSAETGGMVASDLSVARQVLSQESRAVDALAASLDERFSTAVDILMAVTGRVIVTGMGKSGHVGRKIAATFASTGTPSQFVHPAEASHGDLGMITAEDAVLAISNSGEAAELSDTLEYCKRFEIPLIAITSKPKSTLYSHATVGVLLPDLPEAGSMGLAPTTSTTTTIAMGDALAVALLERRGFTASHFRVFHPGGKLGQRLLRISDLMHEAEELPTVEGSIIMSEAIVEMTKKRFGCVGVLDDAGNLAGIVTDGDLSRNMSDTILTQTAASIMTVDPVTTTPDALAMEVFGQMNERKIGAVFVVSNGKPVGIVHLHDMIRAGIA